MRQVKVKVKKGSRAFELRTEFYERDVIDGLVGCTPGQWVVIETDGNKVKLLGIANPMGTNGAPLRILSPIKGRVPTEEEYLSQALRKAYQKREEFSLLNEGRRLVFGDGDHLPGVIVDEYKNGVLVQINTAGMDCYRGHIKTELKELTLKEVYFLDNEEYRKNEGLPLFDKEEIPDLEVLENEIKYVIPKEVLQKIGYYYDHRINRKKLADWIRSSKRTYKTGVDLFSYAGSWGLNALKAGVEKMTFVDQGNFDQVIENNLSLNGLSESGQFIRANVFDWLKKQERTFDVIISDPPAFSKSLKNKSKALGGYQRLHRSLSQLVHSGSLLAIGSCTHGISIDELDQTVRQGFSESKFKLQLLDIGLQGPDHPISHFSDGQNYIKFMLYSVSDK